MADISKLEQQADIIAEMFESADMERIIRECEIIGKIKNMTPEQLKKFNIEKEAKKEYKKVLSALGLVTVASIGKLIPIYTELFDEWHKGNEYMYKHANKPFIPIAENKSMQKIIKEYAKSTSKEILNKTNTKALYVIDKDGKTIRMQDQIYKAFSEAVETVKSGKTDFYTAMDKTVEALGGSGAKVVYSKNPPVTRSLDSVVRSNVMWGAKQASKDYNRTIGKELGTDGIEIDVHSNPRPSHRYMQGQQYSTGEAVTINGVLYKSAQAEGVYDRLYKDHHCYHFETSIFLGISVPRFSKEELQKFDEQNEKQYTINGKTQDGFGWTQSMRALERGAKEKTRQARAYDAEGDKLRADRCKKLVAKYRTKYNEICDVTGIKPDLKRMSVPKVK